MTSTTSILQRVIIILSTLALFLVALSPAAAIRVTAAGLAKPGKTTNVNGASSGHWADDFGQIGSNGDVYALQYVSGKLYAGGSFTEISGAAVDYVSIWNGHDWLSLNGGMNNHVYALAVAGDQLYVGGMFTVAGGVPVNYVAHWDGSSWQALGGGTDGPVYGITVSGSDVYVSGEFTHAGTVAASKIARWDGSSWHPLGSGLDKYAPALLMHDDDLYVGGGFTSAGGAAIYYLARWDGSAWHDVGGNIGGGVLALAEYKGGIYAAGSFSSAGSSYASKVARWDGTSWHPLSDDVDGEVYALAVSGDDLYVGGTFNHLGDVQSAAVGRWDGSSWHGIGNGGLQEQVVRSLAVAPDGVYIGGIIHTLSGFGIVRWNGYSFNLPLIGGVDGKLTSLAAGGATVFAAGQFSWAGYTFGDGLAAFDGANWLSPLHDSSPPIYRLAASDNTLYAFGSFSEIGGVPANNVASWDGANWRPLGSGITTGGFAAMVIMGGDLVVGGLFDSVGGVPVHNVARWDGSSWSALGSIDGISVTALTVWNGDLYAAAFITTSAAPFTRIYRWTGSAWDQLPGSLDSQVKALAGGASGLYAAGTFSHVDYSLTVNDVARWDGSSWSALGSGLSKGSGYPFLAASALAVAGNKVFVGGSFDRAGGAPASNIAMWDGSSWDAMEGGVSGYGLQVNTLAYLNGDLYVGGEFAFAGQTVSHRFAVWHDQPQFSDVSIGDYWYGSVRYLTTHGALSGYSTTPPCAVTPCFNPFANTTRGQATKIIVTALGIPSATPATPTFSDVPADNPFFAAVQGAVAAGVVNGYDSAAVCAPVASPCFRPNSDITRGQLAKIVVNAAGWKLLDPSSATFADVPVGSTFYRAIETAAQHGIISGYSSASGREFRPANSAIRAQLAKIVYQSTR